jgi:hypothetical protein
VVVAFVAIGFMVLLVSDERVGLASWGRMLRRPRATRSPLAGFSSSALRLGALAVVAAVAIPILVPALTDAVLGRHDTGFGNGTEATLRPGRRTGPLREPAQTPEQSDTPCSARRRRSPTTCVPRFSPTRRDLAPSGLQPTTPEHLRQVPRRHLGSDLASATEVTTTISDSAQHRCGPPPGSRRGGSWFSTNDRTVFAEAPRRPAD